METIELPFVNCASLALLFLFLCFIIEAWRKSRSRRSYTNLPPTPPTLAIVTHVYQYVFGGLPHRMFAKLAERYGAILHLQLGEVSTVVISSREGARDVLQANDLACADRPKSIGAEIMWYNYTDIALSPYGEYWRQMRRVCILELLSNRSVRSFGFIRRDEVSRLVESFRASSGDSANLTEKLAALSASVFCRAAFGEVQRDYDELIRLTKIAHSNALGFQLADLFPSSKLLKILCWNKYKLLRLRRKLDAILEGIINEHKSKPQGEVGNEDIVDVLLRVQRNGKLELPITDDNIKAIIFVMFTGGTETSSTTVVWAMAELMRNRRAMIKAQAEVRRAFKGKKAIGDNDIHELKYLKSVVKETLRLHPPLPLLPRACREECTVNGYSIPLKSNIIVNLWALGRNPEYWVEPEAFRPERFIDSSIDFLGNNFEYIPFGSGRRICPGMNFGLANVELLLAQLLYHFDWEVPDGMIPDAIDMDEARGLAAPRKNDLFLVPITYNAAKQDVASA
ncbi:cytochrome P450 71D95-like [Andrographis paniculata]|uniref:cytochrome P450 71D95-like n=1 Tax=Andrographis paniculata TaxID=175694 RepID=UPI0021E77742|nr:cytochrome P450 71D95-like [Andrographis paniculata]